MTVKKKIATGTGNRSENASIKQRSKPATLSKRQEARKGQISMETGSSSSRTGSLLTPLEHKTYSNDPAQVRQWAASSATGFAPFEDHTFQQQFNANLSSETMMTRTESHIPGSFPMSRSHVSPFSIPQATQMFDTGLRTSYNELCVPNAGNSMDGLPTGLSATQPACLSGEVNFPGGQYQDGSWSYPTPSAEDMMYPNSAAMPGTFMDAWPQVACQPGQELPNPGFPCTSNPISWSPLSAIDPSVSSSHSQSSYVGPQPDTPLSQAFHDGTWSSDQQGNLDPEHGAYQGFSIGESLQLPSPVEFIDQHSDALRFVSLYATKHSVYSNTLPALSNLDVQWSARHFQVCGSKAMRPSSHTWIPPFLEQIISDAPARANLQRPENIPITRLDQDPMECTIVPLRIWKTAPTSPKSSSAITSEISINRYSVQSD